MFAWVMSARYTAVVCGVNYVSPSSWVSRMDLNTFAASAQKLIDLLLRYVVPGASAVLAFGAIEYPQPFAFLRVSGTSEVSSWAMFLYVSVVGPAIYAVHRGVLHYPLALALIWIAKHLQKSALSVSQLEHQMAEAIASWRKSDDKWVPTYEAWSAQVHFLYCSAWGVGAALGLHYLIDPAHATKHWFVLTLGAAVLFLTGLISDGRLTYQQLARTLAARG